MSGNLSHGYGVGRMRNLKAAPLPRTPGEEHFNRAGSQATLTGDSGKLPKAIRAALAAAKEFWRCHSQNVTDPVGFGPVKSAQHDFGCILHWRKYRLGARVAVFAGWRLRSRRVRVVSCISVSTAFIAAPGEAGYNRTKPRIFSAPESLARDQAAQLTAGPITAPPGGVALFNDATIAASGVVLTADGRVVAESLVNSQLWSAFGTFTRDHSRAPLQMKASPLSVQKRLSASPHVMMKQTYDANYGHWLIECLPRLAAVAAHFDLAACKFIVSEGHGAMQRVYIDSLAACGIKPEQIVSVGYAPVHVDMLVYPLPITRHPWVKSPAVVRFLEDISEKLVHAAPAPQRIYVSRNRGKTRRLLNEASVIDIVQGHGFETVYPETMSFVEQVATFRAAEIVVGNYGANLTNVVFAPRGVTLFALTTEFMQDDFFWDLIDHKDGRYISLHGAAVSTPADCNADFSVDLDRFEKLLLDIISEPGAPETREVAHHFGR